MGMTDDLGILTYIPELVYDDSAISCIETKEDPEGSDRGGFHQQIESIQIKGEKLVHAHSISDCFEERLGYEPTPMIDCKQDAVDWLKGHLFNCEVACEHLRGLIAKVEATTDYAEGELS